MIIYFNLAEDLLLFLNLIILELLVLTFLVGLGTILLRFNHDQRMFLLKELEAQWHPILLNILADELSPSTLIEKIRQKHTLFFVDYLYRYSQRLVGLERQKILELSEPFLAQVARLAKKGNAESRSKKIQYLSSLGLKAYVDTVIKALDDSSPLVAMTAAWALARNREAEYAKAILGKLHRFKKWNPSFLSSMLATVGPSMALILRETLSDSNTEPLTRIVSADALSKLTDLRAADTAVNVLQQTQDRELIAACLRLLSTVGHSQHLAVVYTLLHSEDFFIRANAVTALGELGSEKDIPLLKQAFFEDPSSWVAIRSVQAIQNTVGIGMIKELAKSSHPRASVAQQVLEGG